jgi:hypothetical protein
MEFGESLEGIQCEKTWHSEKFFQAKTAYKIFRKKNNMSAFQKKNAHWLILA